MIRRMTLAATLALAPIAAYSGDTPAPEGAAVYFISPTDGATLTSPVTVQFGLSGMGVAPAGIDKENTGHHHLLVDRPAFGDGPEDADILESGIPGDDNHRHFGGGQTEITLGLEPGSHTLQLLLGDQNHVPHTPPVMSEVITITVTE